MKKLICILLCVSVLFCLVGCGQKDETIEATVTTAAQKVDIDLTALSGTMVYSEVYNMTSSPEEYVGKMVKTNGSFSVYHDEVADKYYYACLVADASSCCSQGIEFVTKDTRSYPDDFPELGTPITVCGRFDFYEENGSRYIQLVDADLTV